MRAGSVLDASATASIRNSKIGLKAGFSISAAAVRPGRDNEPAVSSSEEGFPRTELIDGSSSSSSVGPSCLDWLSRVSTTTMIGVIVALFSFAYRADREQANAGNSTTSTQRQPLPGTIDLTGTWQDAHDNVWNIRSDGTGRKRNTDRPRTRIYYFEWRSEPQSQRFTIVETSNNMLAQARDTIFGEDSRDFMIEKTSADEFALVDPGTGGVLNFVRTPDSTIENAP